MRTVFQAILADRPRLVAVGVGLRWLAWLAVGHPFFVLAAVFGLARGFGLVESLGLAAIVEVALTLWGVQGLTRGADAVYLWHQVCRFRRRFPATFAKAYQDPRLLALAAGNIYSAPGGLRSVLSTPRLSVVPRAFGYKTVGWVLSPREQHQPNELAAAMERIARSDSRLAGLRVQPTRRGLALIATFAPPSRGRSGLLTAQLKDLDGGLGGRPSSNGGGSGRNPDQPFNTFLNLSDQADDWDAYLNAQSEAVIGPVITGGAGPRPQASTTGYPSTYIHEPRPKSPSQEPPMIIDANDTDIFDSDIFDADFFDTTDSFDSYDPVDSTQPEFPFAASLIEGPPVDGPGFIDSSATWPRTSTPMGWSLFVLAPANVLAGLAVMASDTSRLGIVVLFTMAVMSILLVIAEAMGSQ